jgi:hypothetical protein
MNDATIQSLLNDFVQVAKLSGIDVSKDDLIFEILGSPHQPPKNLPKGRVAIYVFCYNNHCLKVGKAGPKTKQRFTTQHYNPGSAPSTFADSLLNGQNKIGLNTLTKENVGDWIKANTYRFNLLLNKTTNRFSLNLLESFLQARLNPVFEGSGIKNEE